MTNNRNPQDSAPEASSDTVGSAGKHRLSKTVQRRRILIGGGTAALIGGLAVAGFASADPTSTPTDPGTASPGGTTGPTRTGTPGTAQPGTPGATNSVCVLTAQVTEDTYSLDGALVREDIREDKEGIEVQYTFTVVDVANDCAPLEGALVEIWQTDHLGEYSGFVGDHGHDEEEEGEEDTGTFLRGGALTDANGEASIISIWPGHYASRCAHVNMRVLTDVTLTDTSYTGGDVIHTGQLFFDEDINAEVQATSPYSDNTTEETVLSDDTVYDGGGASSGLLTLTALGSSVSDGYKATLTVGVDSSS